MSKKYWLQKKNCVKKKFGSKKFLGEKKFGKTIFRLKINFGSKKFLGQKDLGLKIFCLKKTSRVTPRGRMYAPPPENSRVEILLGPS